MSLPDVIENFDTRDMNRVHSFGPLWEAVGVRDHRIRSGPHVNQLDRDAIEDRGLSYSAIADDQQTRAIEAVMPS